MRSALLLRARASDHDTDLARRTGEKIRKKDLNRGLQGFRRLGANQSRGTRRGERRNRDEFTEEFNRG
jgi:hypothetical protein